MSASWVTRITVMSHWRPASSNMFLYCLIPDSVLNTYYFLCHFYLCLICCLLYFKKLLVVLKPFLNKYLPTSKYFQLCRPWSISATFSSILLLLLPPCLSSFNKLEI
jgi:hypothetical protein